MKANFLMLALLALLLASCQTAKKYVENGDYDNAIELCLRRLRGKDNKKTEYVQALELAFKKAQERDLSTIEQLKDEKRPENWARIHDIHLLIRSRQDKIRPLVPLSSNKGYKAHFDFVDIGKMENESRAKAAEYLYDKAVGLLEKAEGGDKLSARKAYDYLKEIGACYYGEYRDKSNLISKARQLGTSFVLVDVQNNTGRQLPREFEDHLLAFGKDELDSDWKVFFFESKPGEQFDYKIVFNIRDIDISPERVAERTYEDTKQIQDGWDYVLDKRGNVMKDSLGNDIKKPKYVNIRAQILEVHQTKAAKLGGMVEVYNLSHAHLLDSRNLATEIVFENYAATFKGDERALSKESRQRIGNQPAPFPRDEDMIVQAADRLKSDLKDEIRSNRTIL